MTPVAHRFEDLPRLRRKKGIVEIDSKTRHRTRPGPQRRRGRCQLLGAAGADVAQLGIGFEMVAQLERRKQVGAVALKRDLKVIERGEIIGVRRWIESGQRSVLGKA